MRIIIAAVALFTVGFLISDYLFFGFTLVFYLLLALRGLILVFSLFLLNYLKKVTDFRVYDRAVFVFVLAMVLCVLLVDASRPTYYVSHIVISVIGVLLTYLVVPTRFFYQVVPSTVFSVGECVLLFLTFRGFMDPGLVTAVFSLVFANVVAALSSLQMHAYRWKIYQNNVERKETERLVAIGQTAGMIGHDIRNPLQAIVSEIYLAKSALAESRVPPEAKNVASESINIIEEQTEYISKIVSDLQDYARPLKPEFKETDLAKLINSIILTLHVPSGIKVRTKMETGFHIETDPTLIRRVITNLINNAVQAMPDGGALEIEASKTQNQAVISVSDTGQGIPDEVKPRIFTPLMTTKAKGQGLGLAVVKRIVEALGGEVVFESELGKGTKFTVTLQLK